MNSISPTELFGDCKLLENIVVDEKNEYYAAVQGILYGKNKGVITELYYCPAKKGGEVVLPSTLKTVAVSAFDGNELITKISFQDGKVTDANFTIGTRAFAYCKALKTVELPSGLSVIVNNLFAGSVVLETVKIPNTVNKIEQQAFLNCSALTTLDFESGNSENKLVIGDTGIDSNYYSPFSKCDSLKTVVLPERTETINQEAFSGLNALEEITIPSTVTTLGTGVFFGTKTLNKVTFAPNSKLKELPVNTFGGLPGSSWSPASAPVFTSIELPASLTKIGQNCFVNCKELASVKIGANVTEITAGAFQNCAKLEEVIFESGSKLQKITATTEGMNGITGAFQNCPELVTVKEEGKEGNILPAGVEEIAQARLKTA